MKVKIIGEIYRFMGKLIRIYGNFVYRYILESYINIKKKLFLIFFEWIETFLLIVLMMFVLEIKEIERI